ncbi:LD-carboxypeptidase, partial [Flavobacterium circumlabens]
MNTSCFQHIKKRFTLCKIVFLTFALHSFTCQSQQKMITPPYLQKGDTVAILATARKNI